MNRNSSIAAVERPIKHSEGRRLSRHVRKAKRTQGSSKGRGRLDSRERDPHLSPSATLIAFMPNVITPDRIHGAVLQPGLPACGTRLPIARSLLTWSCS